MSKSDYMKLKELSQTVVDLCLEDWGIPSFPVNVKAVRRGRCSKRSITIPLSLTRHPECYQIYYAVHEAVHKIRGGHHGPDFKNVEDQLLEKFGIEIKRAKVYAKSLWLDGEAILLNRKYVEGKY